MSAPVRVLVVGVATLLSTVPAALGDGALGVFGALTAPVVAVLPRARLPLVLGLLAAQSLAVELIFGTVW